MSKGERTRWGIVVRSAPVFNVKGYSGTSVSDLMRETGLEKGGIYGHFSGKEELAVAAFEYSVGLMGERFAGSISGLEGATEKLFGIVGVLGELVDDPPVAGGCPILNTAIEADDTNPVLKEKARAAMGGWLGLVGSIVKSGIASGEFRSDVEPREVASIIVGTLEGALMISKLCDDPVHMQRAVNHLENYCESLQNTNGDDR